jgi:APA family basic amino acid/polyamine antiporter
VISILAFVYSLWAIAGAGQEIVYWGFLFLMAGVPIYVWIRWQSKPA